MSRRPPLALYIPVPAPKAEKETLPNIEAVWNQVIERRLDPLQLLQEANRYLDKINGLPLPYAQRMRIGNILLGEVAAAVTGLFARFFQQGGGIPETREQRESISYAVRAAEQLGIGYKLLFRQDWGGEPGADRARDERLQTAALRILECIRLEQLLRAFRYQKLPPFAWRDANQLYFALRDGWSVAAAFPLKLCFTVEDATARIELLPAAASLEQLYLAIQLTGLLDVISWPVPLMYRVGAYLHGLQQGPRITDDDRSEALPPGYVVVYRNAGASPAFDRSREQLGEALLIDVTPIMRQATQDRAALTASPTEPVAEALRVIPERNRVQFLDMLLKRLQPQQRREPRQRVFDAHRARVYGGFEAVYRLFRETARGQAGEGVPKEPRFWDRLAESSSAVAAPGADSAAESRWVVADLGPGGIQLRQQENDYSMPLFVGRLVAYNAGDEGIGDSRLGYLVRMQRLGGDEVEVAIARLQGRIRATVVEELDALEQRALPALLIQDHDGKLRLLCDNRHGFTTGERLAVVNDDHHYTGTLGEVALNQGDFTVFELHPAK